MSEMKQFIGTKRVLATPMNRLEYNEYRGWELPADENEDDEGYLVEYPDSPNSNHPNHEGYISWSPKLVFDNAYRESTGLTFGEALELVKQGKLVQRQGWNGKGMFIFMRPADELPVDMIVQKVKSLPNAVKDYFYFTCNDGQGRPVPMEEAPPVKFTAYLCMKAADGSVVNGWLASQTDMLAEDWAVVL